MSRQNASALVAQVCAMDHYWAVKELEGLETHNQEQQSYPQKVWNYIINIHNIYMYVAIFFHTRDMVQDRWSLKVILT